MRTLAAIATLTGLAAATGLFLAFLDLADSRTAGLTILITAAVVAVIVKLSKGRR